MKKFKGIMIGIIVLGLMGGLVGCISAPPEQPVAMQEKQEASTPEENKTEEVETATEATTQVKEEGIKLITKQGAGEFVPSEEMKQVLTGDIASLSYNYIYAAEETNQAINDAISAGHYFVAADESAPAIKIEAKEKTMGDTISLAKDQSFKITVSKLKSGSIVKVVSEDGIIEEKKVMGDKYEKRITPEKEGFCFVEIWSGNQELLAVSNPIYVTP